jgi:Ca2+-binding EF-hand superfamily protein
MMTVKLVLGTISGLGLLVGGAFLAARLGSEEDTHSIDAARLAAAIDRVLESDDQPVDQALIIMDERDPETPSSSGQTFDLNNRKGFQLNGGKFESIKKSKADWMARFDADGDGELSEEEIQVSKETFRAEREARKQQWLLDKYDQDGDGVLGADEQAKVEADRVERETKRAEREAENASRAVEAYDTDGDGVLSEDEKQAGRTTRQEYMTQQHEAMQSLFDADSSGKVTGDEREAMHETMGQLFGEMKMVRTFDSNGDNAITGADMPAYMDMFLAGDPRADLDYNGVVNEADLANFQQRALMPPNPAMAEVMGWFNNAPPPVDGGFGNIMMFGGGKDMILHSVEGGTMTIKGSQGAFTIKADLGDIELGGGEHAIVIIETIDSTKDD